MSGSKNTQNIAVFRESFLLHSSTDQVGFVTDSGALRCFYSFCSFAIRKWYWKMHRGTALLWICPGKVPSSMLLTKAGSSCFEKKCQLGNLSLCAFPIELRYEYLMMVHYGMETFLVFLPHKQFLIKLWNDVFRNENAEERLGHERCVIKIRKILRNFSLHGAMWDCNQSN